MTAMSDRPIRVFLVDDHEVVRRGLEELLNASQGFEVVGEAATAGQAIDRITAVRPDVAVVDGRLPDGSGVDVCREVRSRLPGTYCMILTSFDDTEAVVAAVMAGASGYVLKDVQGEALIDDVRQVALGRTLIPPQVITRVIDRARAGVLGSAETEELSERERQVLDLIGEGLTNRQIGDRLHLAEKTVKNYTHSLFAKLGVHRRSQAAVLAAEYRHG